jgi:hypothetical protein
MLRPTAPFRELDDEDLDQVHGGDRMYLSSDALDREGDALAHADAHGAKRIAA